MEGEKEERKDREIDKKERIWHLGGRKRKER